MTEEETAGVTLRLDPAGWLVLQPDGAAAVGARYRLRDEDTGLVNSSGTVEHPQPLRLRVAQGPWRLELETSSGARVDRAVFVGEEPVTVTLPR